MQIDDSIHLLLCLTLPSLIHFIKLAGVEILKLTLQDKPYLAFPCLHCQHQVILELFLAVLTCAVEVILLLQLLPPLLAQAEEIHVGNCQLIPRRNLVQGPQLDSGGRGGGMCIWRSSRSRSAGTELSGTNPAAGPALQR